MDQVIFAGIVRSLKEEAIDLLSPVASIFKYGIPFASASTNCSQGCSVNRARTYGFLLARTRTVQCLGNALLDLRFQRPIQ